MLNVLRQLKRQENKDLRKRIYFTLTVLVIFIIGTNIRVPGTPKFAVDQFSFLELVDAMGGGAFKNVSIFALGVMPYITASIIMELLQMDIIPYFSELRKEGPVGRQKINRFTRYLGILLGFLYGVGYGVMLFGKEAATNDLLFTALIMTAGTAFLIWLGDEVSQKGLGNGMSLIIMAGIIATLPKMIIQAFQELVLNKSLSVAPWILKSPTWLAVLLFVVFILIYILIIVGVVFVQESERRIPIQYTNKTTISKSKSFMPFKINSAGVIPVIFASSLMSIPGIIAQFVKNDAFTKVVDQYFNYTTPVGFLLFVLLIYIFSFFYTHIQIKPDELSKNLNENGGFIPGVRPGKDTENYVARTLDRLTVSGGLFIIIIAGLPILFTKVTGLSQNITVGGTGLLIVVGVALETFKQLESSLQARNYKRGYIRK